MNRSELRAAFEPVLKTIAERSCVTDNIVDKDLYRIYVATLWSNVVLDPADVGIGENDLETLHGVLNELTETILGAGQGIRECFAFVNSKSGEQAMQAARLASDHKDLLLYFASMILDPDGHKRWMDSVSRSRER